MPIALKIFVEGDQFQICAADRAGRKAGDPLETHASRREADAALRAKCLDDAAYSVWKPLGGATSMDDAQAYRAAMREAADLQTLTWDFMDVVSNIFADPDVERKGAAVMAAAEQLSALIDGEIADDEGEAGKSAPVAREATLAMKSLGPDRVGGYAVLWGDAARKDLTGEFFDPQTAELTVIYDALGRLPLLYHHGLDETLKTAVIGVVDTLTPDTVGLWYEAQRKLAGEYDEAISKLLAEGKLKTSSQTFPAARRVAKSGRIERWPIVEITATPTPAEYRMPPLEALKQAFLEIDCADAECAFRKAGLLPDDTEGAQGAGEAEKAIAGARMLVELERERALLESLPV